MSFIQSGNAINRINSDEKLTGNTSKAEALDSKIPVVWNPKL